MLDMFSKPRTDFYICGTLRRRIMEKNLQAQIALSLLNGIGPKRAKILVSTIGSVEGIFQENHIALGKIEGIGSVRASRLNRAESLLRAEREMAFIERAGITPVFYQDEDYPNRLRHCDDGPVILYTKGHIAFNQIKNIAIVGTRKASAYGKNWLKI